MGAGGSLPNNFKYQEPPPLPPPFYTGNLQSGVSRISGASSDSDRRVSGTSTMTLGSPSFKHRTSGSMKNEEWWHQRPAAPSLSSLRPQQETLLTYAAQMTGWQSGCESAVPSMHKEAMELSRTVSHLAAANQQLASAHTTLLGQLEALYLELNRERELRMAHEAEERVSRGGNRTSNDGNVREKFSDRSGNLEASMSDRAMGRERKFRGLVNDEIETASMANEIGDQNENFQEALENRLVHLIPRRRETKIHRYEKRDRGNFSREPENIRSHEDPDLSLEYRKAIDRIQTLENELAISRIDVTSDLANQENFFESRNTRTKRKIVAENCVENYESIDGRTREEFDKSNLDEDARELMEEIERLRNERLEYRERNQKLTDDLQKQMFVMEKLRRDYELSRCQYEKIESSLNERKEKFEALIIDHENAKLEQSRLSKELHVLNLERDIANVRITDLEMELENSTRDKEQITKVEKQESSRLRKILSDEMTGRKEQSRALEEALGEIRRLNEVIENDGRNKRTRETVEIPENESSPEEEVLDPEISAPRSSNMEEFRKELGLKREARQRAIAAVSSEMERLRRELDAEKEAHSETSRVLDLLKSGQATNVVMKHETIINDEKTDKNENLHDTKDWRTSIKPDPELNSNEADAQALTDILKVSDELRSSIRLQTEKIDDLRYHLECEPDGHRNRIANLTQIAATSRESSSIRERQINKLKNLLAQILARLGDPRFRVEITEDVRSEHDRQLEDIRRLKCLYEDRLRVLVDLKDIASKELIDVRDKLKSSRKENSSLEEDLKKAEEKIDTQDTEISNLESQLGLTKADCRDLQNQMSVINGLFTQMLLSASSADMDLDRLTRLLQENHDLISDMAREEGTEAAALPKLLLDIVEQVEGRGGSGKSGEDVNDKKEDDPQEENIAHNLPKVWRVLLELLSCHAVDSPAVTPASLSTDPNSCYKSVDTPSGPRLVISVSKTYIRLKELILEKKHLEKEMNRMKQLNTHLESKLGEQEKRLSTVSSELSKTWNVVGRMQAQHQQLHTHEKILRYELQQKRKMLQELKQELEYCREKWESARQKNTNTEIEWRSLRREFAARKSLAAQDSFNNSGESGFSDERGDDSDEEDEAVEERVRIGPRRRARKDNPRAPTPDTESEQPTDTELSEAKTTPETNVSTEDVSIASTSGLPDKSIDEEPEVVDKLIPALLEDDESQPMNSLDQALANVIENLITVDDDNAKLSPISCSHTDHEDFPVNSSSVAEVDENSVLNDVEDACQNEIHRINDTIDSEQLSQTEIEKLAENFEEASSNERISVFSIGPFPTSSAPSPPKTVQFSDPLIVGPSTQSSLPVFEGSLKEIEDTSGITDKTDIGEETRRSKLETSGQKEEDEGATKLQEEIKESEEVRESKMMPSTSNSETPVETSSKPVRTHEEVLAARSARLRRLEEQADWLMKKMSATNKRGSELSTRLEELHEVYGEAPVPPPMPDILPNVRIPSSAREQQEKESTTEKSTNEMPPSDSS